MKSLTKHRKEIRTILSETLKGKKIKVTNHSDKGIINTEGIIVEETQNMLLIETDNKKISVSKKEATLIIYLQDYSIQISGDLTYGSVKRRKKRKIRNW